MQITDYLRGYNISKKSNELINTGNNLLNVNKTVTQTLEKLRASRESKSYLRTKAGQAIRDKMADYFQTEAGKVGWQNTMCFL